MSGTLNPERGVLSAVPSQALTAAYGALGEGEETEGRPSELLGPKAENCHRMFLKGVKYSKLDFTMIKAGIV